jgi:hypothetical protein
MDALVKVTIGGFRALQAPQDHAVSACSGIGDQTLRWRLADAGLVSDEHDRSSALARVPQPGVKLGELESSTDEGIRHEDPRLFSVASESYVPAQRWLQCLEHPQ